MPVSYPTSANGIIVLLHSLNCKSLESTKYERKKRANPGENEKNLMRIVGMLCKTLRLDRRRLITRTFLAFSRTSKRRN